MLPMTEITKIDYPPVVLWVREGLPVFSLSLSLSLCVIQVERRIETDFP